MNLVIYDKIIREHYTPVMLAAYAREANAAMRAFAKKSSNTLFVIGDERVPKERAYVVPFSFLPEDADGQRNLSEVRGASGDHTDGQEEARRLVVGVVEAGDAQETERAGDLRRERQGDMKYLESERFLVTSHDPDAQKRYAENWERTFGEKPEPEPDCAGTGCIINPNIDPDKVVTEGNLLMECPGCAKCSCQHCGRKLVNGICPDL